MKPEAAVHFAASRIIVVRLPDAKDDRVTVSRWRAALLATFATVIVSGCATPAGQDSGPSGTPPATSSVPQRPMSLTDVDPCALLDTDRAIGLGYAAYERGPLGTSSCLYLPEGANAGDGGMSLSITFGDGLSALTPSPLDKATAAQVGDYSAVRIEASDAPRCTLVIGVSATETVNVGATSATTGQACEQADHIVDLIEPRLPAASS